MMMPRQAMDSPPDDGETQCEQEEPDALTQLPDDDETSMEKLKRSAALFILKVREVKRLPQDTIDTLVEDTKDLFGMMLQDNSDMTRKLLEGGGVDISAIPNLATHLDNPPNPFQGFETEHLQNKYFLKNLGLLVSKLQV